MRVNPTFSLWTPDMLAEVMRAGNKLAIVDVGSEARYRNTHIPGAYFLASERFVHPSPPIVADLPSEKTLSETFSHLGLTLNSDVVAYDDEGGTKACRLLWTLAVAGHQGRLVLLDGGFPAWRSAGLQCNNTVPATATTHYCATLSDQGIADAEYIRSHLDDPNVTIVDARSPAEFDGEIVRAKRCGHIPNAVNIEWASALENLHSRELSPLETLKSLYTQAGVLPENEIIVYCHSHQRSAHTYFVLKLLDYPNVRAYPGSWSEWGNRDDLPFKTKT